MTPVCFLYLLSTFCYVIILYKYSKVLIRKGSETRNSNAKWLAAVGYKFKGRSETQEYVPAQKDSQIRFYSIETQVDGRCIVGGH